MWRVQIHGPAEANLLQKAEREGYDEQHTLHEFICAIVHPLDHGRA